MGSYLRGQLYYALEGEGCWDIRHYFIGSIPFADIICIPSEDTIKWVASLGCNFTHTQDLAWERCCLEDGTVLCTYNTIDHTLTINLGEK